MSPAPSIKFAGALPLRIDIGEGDGISAPGNGQLERKIAFLSAHCAVVNSPGNEVGMDP